MLMRYKIFRLTPTKRIIFCAVIAGALSSCTYFNSIPPVSTLENPSRSRTIGDYPVSGKVLAVQVCSSCHGLDGYSSSPMIPNLAGQQREYLVNQLNDYRDQTRRNEYGVMYMWGMAKGLSDLQINELADYFAQLKVKPQQSLYSATSVSRGKEIFENGIPQQSVLQCNSCHGNSGQGQGSIPRIAGQKALYNQKQLDLWKNPDQKRFMEIGGTTWWAQTIHFERPRGNLMQMISKGLSEADIKAVTEYLETIN